jgi:hypothetical protein
MQRCLAYTLPRHMRSPHRSSFLLIEGRFPQTENNLNNFVIFPTRLFRRRILCTK